jgi:predicted nuclease of restriction endonuclease-like (RecB) superfamily
MAKKKATASRQFTHRGQGVNRTPAANVSKKLVSDLRKMIDESRQAVAQTVNATLVWLHWNIGRRIREEILSALRRELSWTHFKQIIYLDDPLQRDFYAEMCRVERWSTRTLQKKISGMLFERTALSKKPAKLARQELANLRDEDRMSPDLVFRDPYFLDFLGLADTYSEQDLEAAILRELEAFILELGVGFAFVARQKRITVDGEDYYLDLLFYHRKLRRLVAIDLKLDKFKAEYKGQMELYLRWLERHEQQPNEDSPLGLILCAGKSDEHIELLQLSESGIRVAAYLTELPSRDLLRKKLHEVVRIAQARLETQYKEP